MAASDMGSRFRIVAPFKLIIVPMPVIVGSGENYTFPHTTSGNFQALVHPEASSRQLPERCPLPNEMGDDRSFDTFGSDAQGVT